MCRKVHEDSGHKEAIIERRARELAKEGKIIASYAQVEGKGPKCVRYEVCIPSTQEFTTNHTPSYLLQKAREQSQKILL